MRHLALGFMGSVALLAVACGGNVVVDSGSGGSGGGDITTTGDGSSGVTSPVGPASSTGGVSLCEQVCAALQAQGCGAANCVADCQQSYASAGSCAPLLDAVAACYLNATSPVCDDPFECDDAVNSYTSCFTPGECGSEDCSGSSDGSCSCDGKCNGSLLQVQCLPGNATDFCTCFKDGAPIGKCTELQQSGTSCDLFGGCCGPLFFP